MSPVKWDNPTPGQSPLIKHLLAVAHDETTCALLDSYDLHSTLLAYGMATGPAADKVREKMKALDAAYGIASMKKEQDQ